MEGWRMILLVNGGLFLFMAVSTWGLAGFTDQCDDVGGGSQADCDPSSGIAGPMRTIALGLLAVGILLLMLGLAIKRANRPPQP